jgi:hypothetical protein
MPKIKSAFILHSFPMLYSPECIPELREKEDFYALIPTEELALLNNSTWPVVIDHVDEKERSVGNCSSKIIDTSFLFSNDIKVDLKKCTIEDIKNFNKWDETSTSFSYNIIKLEPYEFVDTKGISGNVGDKFLIKYHIINLQPIHLAIVEHGRTGYKGMLRKPLEHSLDNSIANIVKSDIIIHNSIKSLCVINNKVFTPMEKQKKVDNSENIENLDDKEIKTETSELTLDSIKSMFMELVSPMVTKLDSLENKVNSMFSEDDSDEDEDEKLMNKKKSSKLQNSESSLDNEDEDDEDDEEDDSDDDENDDDTIIKNKSSKKKEVIFNSSDIKRQLKAALLEIAPVLKNSKSDEDEKDPYDSFAQRYRN